MDDPTSDPLIAPRISTLSAQLKAGKLTPEDQARSYAGIWPLVTKRLRPFIESLSLEKLAEVLKAHPRLYWHPLVVRQMFHLLRLTRDQEEWRRLGWNLQCDEYGRDLPPNEVDEIVSRLRDLIQAHGEGLPLGGRIEWKPMRGTPGRKRRIQNPYPVPGWGWIDSRTLAGDFDALHKRINDKLEVKGGWTDGDKERYQDLLLKVLKQSDIEWSGLAFEVPKPPAAEPTPSEEAAQYFSDADFSDPWEFAEVVIGDNICKKLDEADTLYEKEGVPRSMAFALLAALLETSPAEIKDKVGYYHRKKGSPLKPTS